MGIYPSSKENQTADRVNLLYFCIGVLFVIIILRLWYIQILKGEFYSKLAKKNRIRFEEIYAPRGIIRDRKGRMVAENLPAYGVAIIREDCERGKKCSTAIRRLCGLLQIDFFKIKKKFETDKKRVKSFDPLVLIRNITFKDLCTIEAHQSLLPGIVILPYPKRYYPYGKVGAHVVGYVGEPTENDLRENPSLTPGDLIGKSGIELVFDKVLRGKKGKKELEVNAQGRTLKEKILLKPTCGKSIYLSLDMELEKFIFKIMGKERGACIVMNPFNGDVIAMVSKPSYDINVLSQGISQKKWNLLIRDPGHPLQNRTVSSCYPPGSVFKLVVAGCGLLHIKNLPAKRIFCPGYYKLGNRIFRCWKKSGHGWMDLKEAIKQSCDVYFYNLGEELGIDAISQCAKESGFGEKTHIRLPGERTCLIPDRKWKLKRFNVPWQKGETLNTAIGQGFVLVSPIQVARFICALVNGGILYLPRITIDSKIKIEGHLPFTSRDLSIIKKAMIGTVRDIHGTAHIINIPSLTIGAKTGTAQVIGIKSEDEREKDISEIPYEYRDHAWMASFGSNGKHTYVVVVLIEHGGHGGSTAGPIVKQIYEYLFLKRKNKCSQ